MTRNQAMRRDDMVGGRNGDDGQYGRQNEWAEEEYQLRPGFHHGQQEEGEQEYDPRAYAPNPEEPYGYDDDGRPIYYEPEPKKLKASSRGGLMMVGAVLAVAIVGGAGAVGYKMLKPGGLSGEPPLIRADTEPVKTLPKASDEAPVQNKAVYDRVDPQPGQKSKVVSREEEPVDLPKAPSSEPRNADASRIILPGGPASAEPTAPGTNGSEPRKVKTVAIRPNAPAAAQAPTQVASSDPIAETARTGQAPRQSEFDNGIMSGDGGSLRTGEPKLASTDAPARSIAPAPKPQTTPAPAARSVATTPVRPTTPAPTAQRTDPSQVAAVSPRAPVQTPTATTASTAGGFVVQVTSQRSEADARSAYANLQKKFPQVLGPYKASIATATVADRGTYYRVRVGPFANGADASKVCGNLRSAGGECVVSKN